MKGIIYKITNKVNGKSYIGQSRYTLEFRWKQHLHKKDKTYFHNAIKKYGPESFEMEVLEECEYKDLDAREIFYIAKFDTFNNGYNLTLGGDGNRRLDLDNKYDEIKELYLSGFSAYKIASLYGTERHSIQRILKSLGVKLKSNKLNINNQEFQELVRDYNSGYSLRELAKRYDCSSPGLKEFLLKKGVDLREKYSILDDIEAQEKLINDYLDGKKKLEEIEKEYHCSYKTILKILSLHGINKGKKRFKLSDKESLEAIKMINGGLPLKDVAKHFEIHKDTLRSLLKRYRVKLSDSIITP